MKRPLLIVVAMGVGVVMGRSAQGAAPSCGDVNGDAAVNIADPLYLLNFLFLSGPAPECRAGSPSCANVNGDTVVNLSDAVYLLNWLFLSGPEPVCSEGPRVDDFAGDFSATSNPTPTGHFMYGFTPTLGGTFTIYSASVSDTAACPEVLPFWQSTEGTASPPYVAKNDTGSILECGGTAILPVEMVWLHPGPAGENSVIRWTSPHAGRFAVAVTFSGIDVNTSTDVSVIRNGALPALFSDNVTLIEPAVYSDTMDLNAGDTIDFVVGYKSDLSYNSDSTGAVGTIQGL